MIMGLMRPLARRGPAIWYRRAGFFCTAASEQTALEDQLYSASVQPAYMCPGVEVAELPGASQMCMLGDGPGRRPRPLTP